MLDIQLRPLKDRLFDPLCAVVPRSVTPGQLTLAAFAAGIASCIAAANGLPFCAVAFWIANRSLDCLDGAVARHRGESSDLGGFLDLMGDFIIYSAIPISCVSSLPVINSTSGVQRRWLAVAVVEATFHINNFVLFFVAALTEKHKAAASREDVTHRLGSKAKELTSLSMKPALVEGAESAAIFTLMLAQPSLTEILCWILSCGVAIGTVQRVAWVVTALSRDVAAAK